MKPITKKMHSPLEETNYGIINTMIHTTYTQKIGANWEWFSIDFQNIRDTSHKTIHDRIYRQNSSLLLSTPNTYYFTTFWNPFLLSPISLLQDKGAKTSF